MYSKFKRFVAYIVYEFLNLIHYYDGDDLDLLSGKSFGRIKSIYMLERNRRNLSLALRSADYSSADIWSGPSGDTFYSCDDHDYGLDFLLEDDIYYRTPLLSSLVDVCHLHTITDIVDCGCGLGHCSAFIKTKSSSLNVSGFDPSPLAITKAAQLYRNLPITFQVNQLNSSTFVFAPKVAYLFMMVLMYFTPSQLLTLADSAISSPGSLLAITEPFPHSPSQYGKPHSASSFFHDIDRIFSSEFFDILFSYDIPGDVLGNASGVGVCHRIYLSKS
jgi:SAM-dependent methyltransferase